MSNKKSKIVLLIGILTTVFICSASENEGFFEKTVRNKPLITTTCGIIGVHCALKFRLTDSLPGLIFKGFFPGAAVGYMAGCFAEMNYANRILLMKNMQNESSITQLQASVNGLKSAFDNNLDINLWAANKRIYHAKIKLLAAIKTINTNAVGRHQEAEKNALALHQEAEANANGRQVSLLSKLSEITKSIDAKPVLSRDELVKAFEEAQENKNKLSKKLDTMITSLKITKQDMDRIVIQSPIKNGKIGI